jgi:phage FluMu protein gp41
MADNDRALDLVGAIVAQNVSDLAFTTNRIIESLERDVARLAQTVVHLDMILADASVIDRKTEARLADMEPAIDTAYRTLERKSLT